MTRLLRREDLRLYQEFTVDLQKRCWATDPAERLPGVILAFDMGAGKTVSTLTTLRELLDQFVIRRALIIAPLLVAQTTWPDEIEEWAHLRALTWTLIRAEDTDPEVISASDAAHREATERFKAAYDAAYQESRDLGCSHKVAQQEAKRALGGTPSEKAEEARAAAVAKAKDDIRRRLAAEDTDIHIINQEAWPWLWQHFGEGDAFPYDVIVCDDVRGIRSGSRHTKGKKKDDGKRKKATLSRFGSLAKARKCVDAVIELTGTPTPNGLESLWGLAYVIDLGERLGATKTAFQQRWFRPANRYSYRLDPMPHSEAEIMARLKDIMFSLDPKDYAEIPPIYPNIVRVKLPAAVMEEYRRFKRTLVSEEFDVEAVSKGVLHNKLLQFANGSMYQEDGEDIPIHDLKLQALEQIVGETEGEPLLVAYSYKFDLARILKKYPKAVVLNETNPRETKRAWNDGKIPMLLAHPASAGHGLNLQFGGHHSVWYGLTSDLELYQQFNKRLARPGQTRPVFNHHIIAEGTIDEDVLPVYLDPKAATQDRVLEAVRVSLLSEESLIG